MGRVLPTLQKSGGPMSSPRVQRDALEAAAVPSSFEDALANTGLHPLRATDIDVLQINLGRRCNLTCRHCHVDAGPDRREVMSDEVVDACLSVLESTDIGTLDLTGGAPELHPRFEDFVRRGHALGRQVMTRSNLVVLLRPNYRHLPEFFAERRVEIVASLPYPRQRQTDAQRGEGVFEESIEVIRRLNELGYGVEGSGLVLSLVSNPVGAFLPADQGALERDWKRQLKARHGVDFNRLFALTNLPVGRFLDFLVTRDMLDEYLTRLAVSFNPVAAESVMCRTTLSVGWTGTLYDCDFNQMLELSVNGGAPTSIFDFEEEVLAGREIVVGPHCFGCTAGQGSSCGGATA